MCVCICIRSTYLTHCAGTKPRLVNISEEYCCITEYTPHEYQVVDVRGGQLDDATQKT